MYEAVQTLAWKEKWKACNQNAKFAKGQDFMKDIQDPDRFISDTCSLVGSFSFADISARVRTYIAAGVRPEELEGRAR
jgi:hypothetical protein